MGSEESNEWSEDGDQGATALTIIEPSAVAALNRSEVMVQLDAAHRYARSIKRFMSQATGMATISVATAESCMYALPRAGKMIAGPSVRLAEIISSAYGNLHVGARVVDIGEKDITAQGVAWDLETNLRVTVEQKRRITKKDGRRFDDDMINVTCAAACSIALRNAIFRVVPRAYVDQVYERCRKVAVGEASTLVARRDEILTRLVKFGATTDRVLHALELRGVEDITLEHLEQLIGYGTALKQGDKTVDEVFPAVLGEVPGASQPGRKVSLRPTPAPAAAKKDEKKSAAAPAPEAAAPQSAAASGPPRCGYCGAVDEKSHAEGCPDEGRAPGAE